MTRVKSLKEFKQLRRMILEELGEEVPTLVVCAGTGGQASGANDIIRIMKRHILENKLQDAIAIKITGCQGFCEMDPFIVVEPGSHLYPKLKMDDVPRIINAAVRREIVEELLYKESKKTVCTSKKEIPFFQKQTRTILGRNERIDPIRIFNYIREDGYTALEKVLDSQKPKWIIEEVKRSGLRGRGGAGFLTGKKWEIARASRSETGMKYIVCNADEGDPGAYMDRSLLEGNPHSIIEGMIIAGIATGAEKGIIYVRTEYPLAIKHTLIALRQARDTGILGNNILGTDRSFDIEIVKGAGAFVCGEETALIQSIEGKIGEPKQRPPYPTTKGINGCPTCINNVETLANIPIIISEGADKFAQVGVPSNTGTKIFSLVGKIRNTGLVEVPMGTTLKEIIYDIGGGPVDNARIKAVQTGGPSGGCIPASLFDLPIDYDSLIEAGSIMGSGGMIVMDENTCMVDIAKYYMKFLMEESCGKCYTCRKGTQRMYEILEDISQGNGRLEQLDLLEELANVVKDTTMCGLGQTAPNPVLSTLRYFHDEYIEHIKYKKCSAGVCKNLVGSPCQAACPVGTEAWRYIAHIQRGEFVEAYKIIREANPFPSVCARVCNHPCEEQCRAGINGDRPIAIRALKRFITDRIDPSVYQVRSIGINGKKVPKIAIIGAGPSGLTAGHYLSLTGYNITVFDSGPEPGGMLISGIPSFRLPRKIIRDEIKHLLGDNIEIRCNTRFGKDITLKDLTENGYKAVYIATGAHKSKKLNISNEDEPGVYPSMHFLKQFNLHNTNLARGKVGILGGGNSAIDSARVALRQKDVESVTLLYRRTEHEMPAFREEIEAAIDEGVSIIQLISPIEILTENGRLAGLKCIRNELGDVDSSGRRRPVPIKESEFTLQLDTLIVAIGEQPDTETSAQLEIETGDGSTIKIKKDSLETNIPGVFAGGDAVTGPNTVIDAIAMGKKAAQIIHRYLDGKNLEIPARLHLPDVLIDQNQENFKKYQRTERAEQPAIDISERRTSFAEVERSLILEDAVGEAGRCLRCDLEFTKNIKDVHKIPISEEKD
ncbi:NADH-ubiquinone oxidoreductase-F iron-sulfur binding region domain-containing protein [candidate division KSB1 bacterium]